MSALPLLTHDGKKWIVHDKAATFLRSIKTPLAVVAVAGDARTGKSYLLNKVRRVHPSVARKHFSNSRAPSHPS